jgi:hypothetical protein
MFRVIIHSINGLRTRTPCIFRCLSPADGVANFHASASSCGGISGGAPRIVCAGCGSELQGRDSAAVGYLPTHSRLRALESAAAAAAAAAASSSTRAAAEFACGHGVICQRCFQAKHYGRLVPLEVPAEGWAEYARALVSSPGGTPLLVFVVDVWDFHGSAEPLLASVGGGLWRLPGGDGGKLGEKGLLSLIQAQSLGADIDEVSQEKSLGGRKEKIPPFLVAINKLDLLPPDTPRARVETWARGELRAMLARGVAGGPPGASRHAEAAYAKALCGVHAVSAARGWGVRELLSAARGASHGRDIVVVGAPNCGKSSLVNALLAEAWGLPGLQADNSRSAGVASARREPRRGNAPLFDELPKGVFVGDVLNDELASAGAEKQDPSSDAGAPTPRRGAAYGSPILNRSLDSSADTAALLADLAMRKSRHRSKKDISDANENSAAADAVTDAATDAMIAARVAAAKSNRRMPPMLPFTASPLPGTTLGVLRAPLDAAGNAHLVDTPGVVVDAAKQRMLVGVATAVASADAAAAAPARGGARALSLLVPARSERSDLPLFRLAPGRSLFLGGLARVDFSHPDPAAQILLAVASRLHVHLTATSRADEVWESAEKTDGTELLWPRWGPLLDAGTLELRKVVPPNFRDSVDTVVAEDALEGMTYESPHFSPLPSLFRGSADAVDAPAPEHARPILETKRRAPPSAIAAGASLAATAERRRARSRTAVADIVLSGLGWLAITPVAILGQVGWARAMAGGRLKVFAAAGVRSHVRTPLLPYAASGSSPEDWGT